MKIEKRKMLSSPDGIKKNERNYIHLLEMENYNQLQNSEKRARAKGCCQ